MKESAAFQIVGLAFDIIGFLFIASEVLISQKIDSAPARLAWVTNAIHNIYRYNIELRFKREALQRLRNKYPETFNEISSRRYRNIPVQERRRMYSLQHAVVYRKYEELEHRIRQLEYEISEYRMIRLHRLYIEQHQLQKTVEAGTVYNWVNRRVYFYLGGFLIVTGFACQIVGIYLSS